jgi:hypothetical protein
MTDTAARIVSPDTAPSIQTPNGVKTMAIAIIPATAPRSATRQAPGTTVSSAAVAESREGRDGDGRGQERRDRHEDERRAEAREAVDQRPRRRRRTSQTAPARPAPGPAPQASTFPNRVPAPESGFDQSRFVPRNRTMFLATKTEE